jgi:O-antigen ligase
LISITNRALIYLLGGAFLLAAGGYAYWQEVYFLGAPVALVGIVLLLQHPQYLFYLLMLSIPWSIEYSFDSSLGTDLPDEPLMLLAALSIIIYLTYKKDVKRVRKLHPLIIIILLQFLWSIITVITSTEVVLSVKYLLAKSWYLMAFVALPVFLFRDEKVLRRSFALLLCSMMAVMIVSLTRHGILSFEFGRVNDALHPFFRNHVNYSALLIFMVPLLIAALQLASSKIVRICLYCLLSITLIAAYFSYARGAWLGLAAGIVAYWLLRKRLLVFGFLLFLTVIVGTVFWLRSNERFVEFSNDYKSTIYHKNFREHLIATYRLKDLSNAERIYRWIAAVRMVRDSWQTGFGPSTFYHQYKSYTLPAFKTYVSDNKEQSTVHNYFLLTLIEQGILGCLLFVSLLIALLSYCQRIYFRTKEKFWRVVISASASVLIMQCVINFLSDMIETDKVGSIFYLCIAVIIIADLKTRKEISDPSANIESIP